MGYKTTPPLGPSQGPGIEYDPTSPYATPQEALNAYNNPPAPAGGGGAGGGDYVPGGYISQDTYLNAKADPENLKRFLRDWVSLGGRGVEGGDGQPASYWDVYNDLANSGVDVSDLPAPDDLPQGTVKGGGKSIALSQPAAAGAPAAPAGPQQSPELTDLLKRLGVDYQNAPAPTPALLAYLRGIGMNLSTAEDTRNKAIQQIQERATSASTETQRLSARNKQNVTADLIRRGVLQSGEATGRYQRGAEDLTQKLSDITRSQTEGIEGADTGYRSAQDAIRQAALEKVLAVEQEQAAQKGQSEAQTEAYRKQQEAADLAYQRSQEAAKKYQDWYEQQIKAGAPAV